MNFESQSIFVVRKITNFEQLEGLGEWKAQAKDMVAGARWQFAPEGVFTYAPAHGRKEIFPLQGNYRIAPDKVFFAAITTFSVSTSIFSTWCSGEIDCHVNSGLMRMHWGNNCSTAGMTVDSLFNCHRRSLYRLTIILRKVL